MLPGRSRTVSTGISGGRSRFRHPDGGLDHRAGGLNYTSLSTGDINSFLNSIGLNNVFNLGKVAPSFNMSDFLTALENNSNVHQGSGRPQNYLPSTGIRPA